jgi:catechol 2,3-dioxygenase-like lactoylglutathione lyase family enzyme
MNGSSHARALCPPLLVSEVERSIRFYVDLGWREVDRVNGPTGAPIRAALERGGYRIVVEAPRTIITARPWPSRPAL